MGDKDKKKNGVSGEEAQLRTILDSMVEAVFVTDSTGRVTLTNDALDQLVLRDAVGRRAKNVIKNEVLRRAIRRARKKGVAAQVELESTIGERSYSLQAQVSPLPDGSGVVTVLHDVTRLRAADRIRRDFVANASHEIRTPLTAIRGFTETLIDGAIDDRAVSLRFLDAIHRHAMRLQWLAEDLTTLAQAESLDHSFESVPTDVRAVCRECAGNLEAAANAKGIDFVYEIPDEKVVVDVSPRALDHALSNLIQNAVKYSPEKTTVTIRIEDYEDQVVIEVEDQGPGVAPEAQGRIFERFFRVSGGRSPQESGTGLGLSIARNMIERAGGELSLESEVGKGSIFRISLPHEEDEEEDD